MITLGPPNNPGHVFQGLGCRRFGGGGTVICRPQAGSSISKNRSSRENRGGNCQRNDTRQVPRTVGHTFPDLKNPQSAQHESIAETPRERMSYPEEQGAGPELPHIPGKWKVACRAFLLQGKIIPHREFAGNPSIECRRGLTHFRHTRSHRTSFHTSFLKNLLDDALRQNKGVNQGRGAQRHQEAAGAAQERGKGHRSRPSPPEGTGQHSCRLCWAEDMELRAKHGTKGFLRFLLH